MKDEYLMTLYKDGDHHAFSRIYEKYAPMVYGYLSKRLSKNEVEDAYQNVWRQLHEKRDLYASQPFAPWFFVLIKNLLIDQYRQEGRKTAYLKMLETRDSEINESVPVDLQALLATLPRDSKEMIQKYYLEGYSYEDLEKESGLSQVGLRKRLSRAVSQLRKLGGRE
ncbi:MAG: RNA polymerase sigma factor [Bacteriovoracaceae bacterium]|nr:RNA polymerase sigma factor [Bacteriovoracaceae bacterium]